MEIPLSGGGAMRGLLAVPDAAEGAGRERPAGGWPAILAIHDIVGFSADIRRITRRFAENGYAALAPALYDGAGAPVLCVVRTVRDLLRREGAAFSKRKKWRIRS